MSNKKLNSTIQFANAISSFLNSQKPSASYQIKKTLLGFLIKTPNSKNQTTDYSYFFISQDLKQSIKCKFNQEMSMEIDLAYSSIGSNSSIDAFTILSLSSMLLRALSIVCCLL